ncbi:hypothetical protein LN042_29530 [Kitasatospora sp. RB6PN24]|uniref:membrane protein YczE n=1 Tax=Kitasatospora humi TaxID=2893891 RepID=UPI001E344A31|nr:hypothetical protein [Kitasatospora humi]MCC9311155.1 hypothetical protein [Kitasatospora humi]
MAILVLPRDTVGLGRRLSQLMAGLVLYGVSMAMAFRSSLGQSPWGVFHQGAAAHLGLSIGTVVLLVGVVVLLLWIPLRQRPGIGTVANVLVLGVAMDATDAVLPAPHGLPARIALMVGGIVLNGAAGGMYIGARFGPGPRDGLMTGLHRRTGRSLRLLRTGVELTVLLTGVLLGGDAGVGTLAYALAIGPLTQYFLAVFTPSSTRGDAERPERMNFTVIGRPSSRAGGGVS